MGLSIGFGPISWMDGRDLIHMGQSVIIDLCFHLFCLLKETLVLMF